MKRLNVSLLLFLYAPAAFSWGNTGHQSAGEIAERLLLPSTRIALNNILGPEKLAYSSTWADMVRNDSDFDPIKDFHFINGKADALRVLRDFPELIAKKETERSVKIAALKYLIHVTQDIHQPLHAGVRNDVGGNFCNVEWAPEQTMNLHEIWDGKIIDYDIARLKKGRSPLKPYTFVNYADDITALIPVTVKEMNQIGNSSPEVWIKESQELENSIYPVSEHDYCQRGATIFPKIDETYKTKAVAIVEKRIFYSGIRLAYLLNNIFKDGINSEVDSSLDKKQIIQKLRGNSLAPTQEL